MINQKKIKLWLQQLRFAHMARDPEEMSPEIQNKGTSGPKIEHVNVSTQRS